MRGLLTSIIVAFAVTLPVHAQTKFSQPEMLQGADPSLFKPLNERKDVVSWRLLAQVELVKLKDR